MLSSERYDPNDVELTKLRKIFRQKTEAFNTTSPDNSHQRENILKSLFGSTGQNIHVGENFYANFNCVILDVAEVRFGDNCFLSPQAGIYTATHPLLPAERNSRLEMAKPITIGDNCWIGGHVTINPGVSLGNSVICGVRIRCDSEFWQ